MITNQEPAFPRDHAADGHNGMSLLDYMAISAMRGMIAGHFACYGHENYWPLEGVAIEAYDIAEAMMTERAKRVTSQEAQSAVAAAFGGIVQTPQG